MNLTKEYIRRINVDGVMYYQMPEIIEQDCTGCVLHISGQQKAEPTCTYLSEQSAQCSAGVWTTAEHKETYCVELMTYRLTGEPL